MCTAGAMALATVGLSAQAGGIDMAAIQKWNAAKVVRYQITGVFKGTTPIAMGSQGPMAPATVTDRVTVDVQLEVRSLAVVGTPKFTNAASSMTGLTSGPAKCPPPVPAGTFEFLEVASIVPQQGAVELKGTRTFPSVAVSTEWPATCATKNVAGGSEPVSVTLPVPSPVMLALPMNPDPKFTVSADRKTFMVKTGDWTWTYTPTIVQ
jgi:hypothetical protein